MDHKASKALVAIAAIAIGVSTAEAGGQFGPPRHVNDDPSPRQSRFHRWDPSGRGVDREPVTMPLHEQTWDVVTYTAREPDNICSAVRQRVKYAQDLAPEDEWKEARDTWNTGRGDCEDFAVVVRTLCEEQAIKADVYCFYPSGGTGHAVTIGEWQGQLWMSSNGSFETVHSIEDAKQRIAARHGWRANAVSVRKGGESHNATANCDRW